jgi:hypothetical protein
MKRRTMNSFAPNSLAKNGFAKTSFALESFMRRARLVFSFYWPVFARVLAPAVAIGVGWAATARAEAPAAFHANPATCLKCHFTERSGDLHLLTGERVGASDVPRLCGQCHGIRKRDWDKNLHGKTVGGWQRQEGSQARKLACIECHQAHKPKFPIMAAKPPPPRAPLAIPTGPDHGR